MVKDFDPRPKVAKKEAAKFDAEAAELVRRIDNGQVLPPEPTDPPRRTSHRAGKPKPEGFGGATRKPGVRATPDSLKPHEMVFVAEVLAGKSRHAAWRVAMNEPHAHIDRASNGAVLLAKRPRVAAAIEEGTARALQIAVVRGVGLRHWIVDQFIHEAMTATKAADRLRALELLGKSAGVNLFREAPKDKPLDDPGEARKLLAAKLAKVLERATADAEPAGQIIDARPVD